MITVKSHKRKGRIVRQHSRNLSSYAEHKVFSDKQREKLASKGAAMPDGSYPINSKRDLANAVQSVGRAKNPSAVKAHIRKRAKALGMSKDINV